MGARLYFVAAAAVAAALGAPAWAAVHATHAGAAWQVEEGSGAGAGAGGSASFSFTWALVAAAAVCALAAFARVRWLRIQGGVGPTWRLAPLLSIVGFAGALVAAAIGAEMVGALLSGSGAVTDSKGAQPAQLGPLARSVVVGLAASAAQLVWMGAVMLAGRGRWLASRDAGAQATGGATAPQLLGARPRRTAPLLESIGLMLAASALAMPVLLAASALAVYIQQLWWGAPPLLGHETLQQMADAGTSDPWFWAAAATAAIVAPCVEEPLNRGFLQQGLQAAQVPRGAAILATAAIFAMLHWSVLPEGSRIPNITTLVLLAVLWGWLYERTGRLSVCIAAHALFNVVNLAQL